MTQRYYIVQRGLPVALGYVTPHPLLPDRIHVSILPVMPTGDLAGADLALVFRDLRVDVFSSDIQPREALEELLAKGDYPLVDYSIQERPADTWPGGDISA